MCLLCRRVFAVSHGGLNDVKTHCKGKRHIELQLEQESRRGRQKDSHRESLSKNLVYNEEANVLEEISFGQDTKLDCCSLNSDEDFEWRLRDQSINLEDMNSQPKMLPQQYCLRWKYHHNNLQVMFSQLLERESFCDVTLACEGKTLRAHKVVLSACSTYFDAIFSQYEENNPIVILKDVKFSDIKALVEFMYKGEINIDHSHLASLLKTAEDLRIKGLAEVSWRQDGQTSNTNEEPRNNIDGQTPHAETLGNGSDIEPPVKRRRGRPPLDTSTTSFSPKVASVTGAAAPEEMYMEGTVTPDVENENRPWDGTEPEVIACDAAEPTSQPPPTNTLPSDNYNDQAPPEGENNTPSSQVFPASGISQVLAEKYRDVIKLNDYLTTGRRQQFWEEPFTRRIMEDIKSKELEMKTGAELLGVSYGTLYGRYRDAYGCLKHPYRVRDFWSESGPADVLAKVQRKEVTLFRAAEMLNVTVTTLANYLSTLRQRDSSSGDEGVDETMDVDGSFEGMTMTMSSTPKNLTTAALENNPDITIVKQENTLPISNHEQEVDSAPSSIATNNNAEHSDSDGGDEQETNGTHDIEQEK